MSDSDLTTQSSGSKRNAGQTERLRYRLLTGQDTDEFCERVSEALNEGYVLYGSPALTFDPDQGTRVAAQALILPD